MKWLQNAWNKVKEIGSAALDGGKKFVAAGLATFGIGSITAPEANAAIVLTDFTTALDEVGTAVTAALGDTVSAGLAIAGVIMGGMLLWRLFRRIAKA